MKKILIVLLLFSFFNMTADAKTQKIKIGLSNGGLYVTTSHVKVKSPKLIKNKYAKLINISI